MIFADALDLAVWPMPAVVLAAAAFWYIVFNPPYGGRFAKLRRRSLYRREVLRWMSLVLALCFTLLIAAFIYHLIAGQR